MAENAKKAAYGAEEITTWLARETGHTDVPDEGYGEEENSQMLPAKRRTDLSKFFDGLHVQKEMQARRRDEAVSALDDADELRKSIAPRLTEGPNNATSY